MKALVLSRPGQMDLAELEVPAPEPTEVLVRVAAAGICKSDLDLIAGAREKGFTTYPIVPGHEWAGTVVALGAEVDDLDVGDRVVAEGFRGCGYCVRCREGYTNLCRSGYAETGFTHAGAFAEYISVPARLIHRLPIDSDLVGAALLEPLACVAQGAIEVGLRAGDNVAVVGAGVLGLLALMLTKTTSPTRLVAIDKRAAATARAEELTGAESYVVGDRPLPELGRQFDVVWDTSTTPSGSESAFRLARPGGSVILLGIHGRGAPNIVSDQIVVEHLTVQGVRGASARAWSLAARLYSEKHVPLEKLLVHRFDLENYREAFAAAGEVDGAVAKVQFNP